MLRNRVTAFVTAASFAVASCGGGSSSGTTTPTPAPTPTPSPVYAVPTAESLTTAEVTRILQQAVGEAQARNLPSVISVVDRVGNVLAVYAMNGALPTARIPSPLDAANADPKVANGQADINGPNFDFQDISVPAAAGAISKAITAAYLSSSGNAFTSRTASDIVQENFPKAPNTVGLESGPLFGVQFSSLPCSDLAQRFGVNAMLGPKRSPLGLSADPGSVPLYKNGVVVGGIGVMGDGVYGADSNTIDVDNDPEEFIALAGSQGFAAPTDIEAGKVSIDGTLLSFIDATVAGLKSNPSAPPALAGLGNFVAVGGYYDGNGVIAGTAYGTPASGYRLVSAAERSAGTVIDNAEAFILVDAAGNNRFPIRGGTDGADVAQPLTAAEVKTIGEEAFKVLQRARGAIRQPHDSPMQATISIVDSRGQILTLVRAPDAPVFGTDVSLQKARTVAFFSSPRAASDLLGATGSKAAEIQGIVQKFRDFLNDPAALTGTIAFSDRAVGLLARPMFPDGEVGTPNGPLSRPLANFNPFSVGLQSALIFDDVVAAVSNPATPKRCTTLPDIAGAAIDANTGLPPKRLQNGIQIFPGASPIYRGNVLVGAIGLSGDGIDQDDLVGFLGLYNAGQKLGTIGHAAQSMRISSVVIPANRGGFLPYVQCPIAPFAGETQQNVCQGK